MIKIISKKLKLVWFDTTAHPRCW